MRYSAPHRAQETSGEFNGEDRQFLVCLKNLPILLANSKSLSFSILVFGLAQERLD
jgi:hypothetical protein